MPIDATQVGTLVKHLGMLVFQSLRSTVDLKIYSQIVLHCVVAR